MTMQEERLGVGAYLNKCMHQGLEVFKHPMMLLPTLVLGAIWLVIGYLSSTTELPGWAKVVSFLSFAEGGLFGGALGAAGGIVGMLLAVPVAGLMKLYFDRFIQDVLNRRNQEPVDFTEVFEQEEDGMSEQEGQEAPEQEEEE